MKDKKNSLGTGLEALLGKDKNEERERGVVKEIQLNEITPSQYQPRKKMHKETLEELAQSIKQQGVLQPVLVRRQASGSYELVVGERRWRASQVAGLKTIPAIIKNLNNDESAKIALIENLQREDLNYMDQARGLHRLKTEFNLSQEELGASVGKSRPATTNLLRLMKLNPEVQAMLEEGKLDMGHARALLSLDESEQIETAKKVFEEKLSVRQTEKLSTGPTKKRKKLQKKDPNTLRLEREISDALGAQAQILQNRKRGGKLTINFANPEDLQRILERIKG